MVENFFLFNNENVIGVEERIKNDIKSFEKSVIQNIYEVEIEENQIINKNWYCKKNHFGFKINSLIFHVGVYVYNKIPQKAFFIANSRNTIKYKEKNFIGYTSYSLSNIISISSMLVENFINYHVIYWNSYKFINCFLSLICEPNFVPIYTTEKLLRTNLFAAIISDKKIQQIKNKEEENSDLIISSILPNIEINVKNDDCNII